MRSPYWILACQTFFLGLLSTTATPFTFSCTTCSCCSGWSTLCRPWVSWPWQVLSPATTGHLIRAKICPHFLWWGLSTGVSGEFLTAFFSWWIEVSLTFSAASSSLIGLRITCFSIYSYLTFQDIHTYTYMHNFFFYIYIFVYQIPSWFAGLWISSYRHCSGDPYSPGVCWRQAQGFREWSGKIFNEVSDVKEFK